MPDIEGPEYSCLHCGRHATIAPDGTVALVETRFEAIPKHGQRGRPRSDRRLPRTCEVCGSAYIPKCSTQRTCSRLHGAQLKGMASRNFPVTH